MTLYLKRDVSAGGSCFVVFDAMNAEKYRAEAPTTGLMQKNKLVITDACGNRTATIRRILPFGAAYAIRVGKRRLMLVMLPSVNGFRACFYGCNWRFVGAVAAKNFSIIDVDKTLILEHRRHADYCALTVPDSANAPVCVAASVCINLLNTIDSPALQAV